MTLSSHFPDIYLSSFLLCVRGEWLLMFNGVFGFDNGLFTTVMLHLNSVYPVIF